MSPDRIPNLTHRSSLKGRTFKAIELNKYIEIVAILAILTIARASLKLARGQSNNQIYEPDE